MSENSQRAFGPPSSSRGERGTPGRRTGRGGILATLTAAVLSLALVMAPGAGAIGFQEDGNFTDAGFNIGTRTIAVDPASGNVYVPTAYGPSGFPEPGKIFRFDASGTPLTPVSMGSGFYTGIAVEQGGDHTVYGYDNQVSGTEGTPYIEAFDNAGTPVGSPFPLDVGVSGTQIASDSEGNIYFPDWDTSTVKKFTAAGATGTPAEFACEGSDCESTALSEPRGVAVDAQGNLYVADTGNSRVVKFNSDGSYDSIFYEGAAADVAIDPSSEVVLVAGNDGEGQHVTALDYDGNQIGEIPTTEFAGSIFAWMAVNPTTETLYVLKFSFASSAVAVYNILAPPTATTGSATAVTATTATLNGTVNPKGSLSEDCRFEYTDDADFQANEWANADTAPCNPQPFNEDTDVAVSANLTSLSPGTTYHYRVIEETEFGTGEGEAEQFTTLVAPTATTGSASDITQHTATLSATVNPKGEASTDCHIEWGPAAGNYSTGQAACSPNPGSASIDTAVSASASGLAANTTYHYRVVQATAAGTANGLDQSFTTLADTCATNPALCPPPPPSGGGDGGSTPPPPTTTPPPPTTPPAKKKPLKCKKGFKKKTVKAKGKGKPKTKCVKVKKKSKKKR